MIGLIIITIAGLFTFFYILHIIRSYKKDKYSSKNKTESGFFNSVYESLSAMSSDGGDSSGGSHSNHSDGFHGGGSHHGCSSGHSCSSHSCGGH